VLNFCVIMERGGQSVTSIFVKHYWMIRYVVSFSNVLQIWLWLTVPLSPLLLIYHNGMSHIKKFCVLFFYSGKSVIRRHRVDQQDWYLLFIPKLLCCVMQNSEVFCNVRHAGWIHEMYVFKRVILKHLPSCWHKLWHLDFNINVIFDCFILACIQSRWKWLK
jgi:hypothetical protein